MGLIKSNVAPAALASFSMRDVEQHARQIILRAQQKAEQMLAAAQEQAEQLASQLQEEARQRGFDHGSADGRQEGLAAGRAAAVADYGEKFSQAIDALSSATVAFDVNRAAFESQITADVIHLSIAIARRVTQQQGQAQPAVLVENVRQAVRLVSRQSAVTVTLHPEQKDFLLELLPELQRQWPAVTHVELQTDAAIQPGGCRVSAGGCEIDAELDHQIDRIVADLLPTHNP